MEREGTEVTTRLMRAVRSLVYNRKMKPVIEGRIERAEAKIRSYLLSHDLTSSRLGSFQVDMDEMGELNIEQLPVDDWQQMKLQEVSGHEEYAEKHFETRRKLDPTARIHTDQ